MPFEAHLGRSRVLACIFALLLAACSGSGPVNYLTDDSRQPDAVGDQFSANDATSGTDGAADDAAVDVSEPPGDREEPDTDSPDTPEAEPEIFVDAAEEILADAFEEVVAQPKTYDTTLVGSHEFSPWAEVRHYEVSHPGLTADKFIEKTSWSDPDRAALFDGETTPDAGHFLLHIGPDCAMEDGPERAAMLIHGAGGNAQQSFVEPALVGTGLAPKMMDAGWCVYGITFAHPFGNNLNQAIALAAGLEQARLYSGLDELDVVAHSKGGLAAVAYASGLAVDVGVEYGGAMDRLVLMGVPLGGTDFTFRHPNFNYPIDLYQLTMPSAWDKILEWGVWKDVYDASIYGGAFDGVLQMTAAWDDEYALSMIEQDYHTTYYGGQGFVSHSLGIAKAIEMGGNFIAELHKHQLPADIDTFIGSGGNPMMNGVMWETTGPSDGLVFEKSAQDTTCLPNVAASKHFPLLNHWDLVASGAAHEWVVDVLGE